MNLPRSMCLFAAFPLAMAMVPAQAADPAFCTAYANIAVAQQGANTAKGCGFVGPRWQAKFGAHFAWCLTATKSMANHERQARNSQLASCSAPGPQYKTFLKPKIGGVRLDWCRVWAAQCGAPAANAYCQSKGYNHATSFGKANNIGQWTKTRVITSGQICNGPDCAGFTKITCKK